MATIEKKYTLGEAAGTGILGSIVVTLMFAGGCLVSLLFVTAYAWIDLHAYRWFFIPYLHTPQLTLLQAAGIMGLIHVIRWRAQPDFEDKIVKKNHFRWIEGLIIHGLTWFTAWVLHMLILRGW